MTQVEKIIFFEKHQKKENYEKYLKYEALLDEKKILAAWRVRMEIST